MAYSKIVWIKNSLVSKKQVQMIKLLKLWEKMDWKQLLRNILSGTNTLIYHERTLNSTKWLRFMRWEMKHGTPPLNRQLYSARLLAQKYKICLKSSLDIFFTCLSMPSAAGKPGQLSDPKGNKASKALEGYSYTYSSHIVVWSLDNTRGREEAKPRAEVSICLFLQ